MIWVQEKRRGKNLRV